MFLNHASIISITCSPEQEPQIFIVPKKSDGDDQSLFYILKWDTRSEAFLPCTIDKYHSVEANATFIKSVNCNGLYGVVRLETQSYVLVYIKEVSRLGEMSVHGSIYDVSKLGYVVLPQTDEAVESSSCNNYSIIDSICELGGYCQGVGLFASYTSDVTVRHGAKSFSDKGSSPRSIFAWNDSSSQALPVGYVVPICRGYFASTKIQIDSEEIIVALCCRQSARHAGTRYNCRGLDNQGNAANYCETEQLICRGSMVTSYIICRGSVPLKWSQLADFSFKPQPQVSSKTTHLTAFRSHIILMGSIYRDMTFHCVNLMSSKCIQKCLSESFAEVVKSYNSCAINVDHNDDNEGDARLIIDPIYFTQFDIGSYLNKGTFEEVARHLLDSMKVNCHTNTKEADCRVLTSCWNNNEILQQQGYIVRINCLDCLDRSNIAQCMLAIKEGLPSQVRALRLSRDLCMPIEMALRQMWIAHGDCVSTLYAGSVAHFSDLIKSGKRDTNHTIQSLQIALLRYYNQNFRDRRKQAGISLLTGAQCPYIRPDVFSVTIGIINNYKSVAFLVLVALLFRVVFVRYQ